MTDQIKYIVATICAAYPEADVEHYIAKQGSNGPIKLSEPEIDAAVRKLNGKHTQDEVDEFESYVKFALAAWRSSLSQAAIDLLGPNDFDALIDAFMFKPRENIE